MILGLSGYARSGKNTVADMFGSEYRHVSFAEPMREALLKLDPMVENYDDGSFVSLTEVVGTYGWDKAKKDFSEVRRLLQVLGTEVGRGMFGKDFWVDQAMRYIEPEDNVIITDVRFLNEAWAITEMDGEVWRINRDGVGAVNAHSSETALDDWAFDRVIDNNGTLDELREKVLANE